VLGDFTTWTKDVVRANIGGEYFLERKFRCVSATVRQGTNSHAVSGGLGYIGQQWSAEYSVRRDVVGDHPRR